MSLAGGGPPIGPLQVTARYRHRHRGAPATLIPTADGRAQLSFAEPQGATAAGQAVVFYQGEQVVGGGTLHQVIRSEAAASPFDALLQVAPAATR